MNGPVLVDPLSPERCPTRKHSSLMTEAMNKRITETVIFPVLSTLLVVTALFVSLEVVFRLLPIADYSYPQPVNNNNPVPKLLPDREMTISQGWNFLNKNTVRINNDGFINDQDYSPADTRPLVAVVGDSYIEALIVPYKATLQGRLAQKFRNTLRVYSFGFSGAPLSQYLVWAKYARERYLDDFLVINVVGNDFDESLLKYKSLRGSSYYSPDANDNLRLVRIDYETSNYRFVFKSALMRYLLLNLQAANVVQKFRALVSGIPEYVGNVSAVVTPEIISDSKQVIEAFFRDLPSYSGLPNDRVVLLLDGMRPNIYDDQEPQKAEGSYFDQMRRGFMASATSAWLHCPGYAARLYRTFQSGREEVRVSNGWALE